jgi:hypothetical protein
MKAQVFEKLIRKVVREEIDYALGRELKSLKEDLRSEMNSTIVENIEKPIKTPQMNTLKEKIMGKKQKPNHPFTNNTALNDLLNETAQGDTNLEKGSAPMQEAYMQTASPGVTEAITRDYSDLMGAIYKK